MSIFLGQQSRGSASCMVSKTVQVPLSMRESIREVSRVYTPKADRGQGLATALMRDLCEQADALHLALLIHVQPYSDSEMDAAQLEAWYARFGFQVFQEFPKLMARPVGSTPRVLKPIAAVVEAM